MGSKVKTKNNNKNKNVEIWMSWWYYKTTLNNLLRLLKKIILFYLETHHKNICHCIDYRKNLSIVPYYNTLESWLQTYNILNSLIKFKKLVA